MSPANIRPLAFAIAALTFANVLPAHAAPDARTSPAAHFPIATGTVKPDFSAMKFLVGYWNCTWRRNDRRATEVTSTDTYALSPDGYFLKWHSLMLESAFATKTDSESNWISYEARTKRWMSVSVGRGHNLAQWNEDTSGSGNVWLSTSGTLYRKVNENEIQMMSVAPTATGLVNRVNGRCTKV